MMVRDSKGREARLGLELELTGAPNTLRGNEKKRKKRAKYNRQDTSRSANWTRWILNRIELAQIRNYISIDSLKWLHY